MRAWTPEELDRETDRLLKHWLREERDEEMYQAGFDTAEEIGNDEAAEAYDDGYDSGEAEGFQRGKKESKKDV